MPCVRRGILPARRRRVVRRNPPIVACRSWKNGWAPLCFTAESHPVSLTPAGEEFLTRAHRLREDIFDARRAVLSASSHFKKALRIYTTNTLAANFLSPWLIENKLENYSLIVASIAGCVEAVKRRHADMGLIPHFGSDDALPRLQVQEIGEDP